ncbi:MAG: hypothetical protein Tsb0013_11600 [Phycisphaerales bacterium]
MQVSGQLPADLITDQQRLHRALVALFEAHPDNLCDHVCDLVTDETGMEFVRIARFEDFDDEGHPTRARVVATDAKDRHVIGAAYDLAGTPCERAEQYCVVYYPDEVAELFPEDEILTTLGVRSYCGVALTGLTGDQLGLIYAMSKHPMTEPSRVVRRLALIGHRFAYEMDRRRVDTRRTQSEERYRELVEAMPDGLVVHQNGRIVFANPQAARLRGYERAEDLIGCASVPECGCSGVTPECCSGVHMVGDGIYQRPVDCTASRVMHEGAPAVQVIERDLSAVKEQERRLLRIFDLSPNALAMLDTEGRLLRINASMRALTGVEWVGTIERVMDDMGEPHATELRRLIDETMTIGGLRACEYTVGVEGGMRRVWSWSAYADPESGTVTLGAKDITRERDAQRLLRRTDRMSSTNLLTTGLAHDLGNLFTAIGGQLHVARSRLEKGNPVEDVFDDIDDVLAHAQELRESLQTLGGGTTQADRDVDLVALIEESATLLERLVAGEASIHYDLDDARGYLVRGDPGRLRQVLVNMVVNARDAIRQQGRDDGEIKIVVLRIDGHILITLIDNGPGVPPELEERIFEPFFTTHRRGSGTGLGLALCRAIIEQHGGRVELLQTHGRGAHFEIVLPRVERRADTPPAVPLDDVPVFMAYHQDHEHEIITSLLDRLGMRVVRTPREAKLTICSADHAQTSTISESCVVVLDPDEPMPDERMTALRRPFGLAGLERALRLAMTRSARGEA